MPPLEEYRRPKSTGKYYYAIYIGEGVLEAYARRVNPKAAEHSSTAQLFYAIDYLRWLVDEESLDIQFAILRKRNKEAMPFITEQSTARVLCLFPFKEEAVRNRMPAEKVEKVVDVLGCRPDWFEIFFFC